MSFLEIYIGMVESHDFSIILVTAENMQIFVPSIFV